jgi:hypothetical protein
MTNIPYEKQYVDGELINPITKERKTRGPNRRQRKQMLKKRKR